MDHLRDSSDTAGPAARHTHAPDCPQCTLRRRTVLMSAGAVGVAGLLGACGGEEPAGSGAEPTGEPSSPPSETGAGTDTETPGTDTETQGETTPGDAETGAGEGGGGEAPLATTSEVPVGGGVVIDSESVVVTQPTAGEFVAFSSICTHQGCSVTSVSDGVITCPCHQSEFSAADGSVLSEPATAPLPEVAITVEGDQIRRA